MLNNNEYDLTDIFTDEEQKRLYQRQDSFTVANLCFLLDKHKRTIWRYIHMKRLKAVKIALHSGLLKVWLVTKADLNKFVRNNLI